MFSRTEVKKHPSVVVLQPSGEGISSRPWLQAARFDVYGGRVEGEYHEVTGEVVPTVEELYRPFDMKVIAKNERRITRNLAMEWLCDQM